MKKRKVELVLRFIRVEMTQAARCTTDDMLTWMRERTKVVVMKEWDGMGFN